MLDNQLKAKIWTSRFPSEDPDFIAETIKTEINMILNVELLRTKINHDNNGNKELKAMKETPGDQK